MKSNRIVSTIAGVLLFLSIILTFIWALLPAYNNRPKELSLKDVFYKIEDREIKEINFFNEYVEIIDKEGKKFVVEPGSEMARESLIKEIGKFNENHSSEAIKYSEAPASSGWGGIVLINTLPFFIMWAATLVVIVYAVRTLSRNKG